MAAWRAMRFASVAEGSNVGSETLDNLYDEVARISTAYPREPLNRVLGDLIEAQDVAFRLLEGRQRPRQTAELYLLSGVVSLMLAKASHDLGDPRAAMRQARTAYICADNADHDGLRLRVRAQQSLMAYWAGWATEAARYADLGRELASAVAGSAGVWMLSQSARTYASLGDSERARADLALAATKRDSLADDELDQMDGLMRFADCRYLYYCAEARIWIPGAEDEAEHAALQAIAAYDEAAAAGSPDWAYGDDAGARSDLALVRAAKGELDGVAEALRPVLDLPPDKRVAGVIASAMRVHGALREPRYHGSRQATRVQQEIEAYGRTPAAALSSGQ
ncbi:hypothetical protein DEF23_13155 [Marinitenerispora sediminis]|uniref:XRE family transcriptional regulator n=2 Tax=Marinitenerispora sediminis TaxID=1931232 RepID=A0A368TBV6_9ACTN|nr:hypothetical protein DEF23_13155 [Marinitenerispora sediminis]RCV57992.1 hypothetical protein DEF28_00855 [Marinitenerispora sediminis]RCV62592.1 hypothetical protein DEF24_00580 [Marinitenerispora sediminis]